MIRFVWLLLLLALTTPLEADDSISATNSNVYLIDLPAALRLAGARNIDVHIARQKLAEAQANYETTLWQFFPWLGPGVSYRRHDNLIQNVEGKILEAHKESYAVGPSLIGQLDLGDAIYKRLAASQLVKASDFDLEAQRQDAILIAAHGYFDLARAGLGVNIAQEALGISTNYSSQVEQAVAAGIAFKADLLRVQTQVERNSTALRQAEEQQRVAGIRLAQTLRLDPALELTPRDKALAPLSLVESNAASEALVHRALAARPELKRSRAVVEAARNARQAAVYGPLIPAVGAQVFVGGLGGGQDSGSHTFGESEDYQVTLGWRIGPGGLFDRGRIHTTESRLQIATLSEMKLIDDVTRQVIESQTRVHSLNDQIATAQRSIHAAEETLHLSNQRKEFGIGAVLETIQAQQELTRARLDLLNAIAEQNKAEYSLTKAVGGINAESPQGH